jgi:hypothetical protein
MKGYVTVKVDWVISCCRNTIKAWEHNSLELKNKMIAKEMNKRLFPAKTVEKALKRLNDIYTGYPWEYRGVFWKHKAEEILKAVQYSSIDTVLLSTDMVEFLSRYKEEN